MSTKVLIVDDDIDLLLVLKEALLLKGFEVYTEAEIDEIIASLNEVKPDILIIDYLLGSISGGDMCSYIKKDKIWHALPVIIMSAYPRVIQSLGYYGCNAFVSKPFDLHRFVEKITELTTYIHHA